MFCATWGLFFMSLLRAGEPIDIQPDHHKPSEAQSRIQSPPSEI